MTHFPKRRPRLAFLLFAFAVVLAAVVVIQKRTPFLDCRKQEFALAEMIASKRSCSGDADCVLLPLGCDSSGGCDLAVSRSESGAMREPAAAFRSLCGALSNTCGSCARRQPACQKGLCAGVSADPEHANGAGAMFERS